MVTPIGSPAPKTPEPPEAGNDNGGGRGKVITLLILAVLAGVGALLYFNQIPIPQ